MSITDELRKFIEDPLLGYASQDLHIKMLTKIADRIDAAVDGMIELPKDADNVPVSIGDRMEWVRYKDDDPTIVRTVSGIGNGMFFAWSDEQGRYAQYKADAYRHHHAPTVEDVLTEFGIDWEHESDCEDRAALLKEYASKLRLAEGVDA